VRNFRSVFSHISYSKTLDNFGWQIFVMQATGRLLMTVHCAVITIYQVKQSRYRSGVSQRVPESYGSQISWQRHRMVVRLSALRTGRIYSQEILLVLISVYQVHQLICRRILLHADKKSRKWINRFSLQMHLDITCRSTLLQHCSIWDEEITKKPNSQME
jgi:hypothetical protein